ncbi:hypothetical protein ACG7TL_005184 [Trametes sanguinea]
MKRETNRLANRAAKRRATLADVEAARQASRAYHKEIRRQKRQHWREYVESATEKTIWQASKYVTQAPENTLASRLPALNLPNGAVARTCHEKREALMAQFFPEPPDASLDDITDTVHDGQLPLALFTQEDVAVALSNLSPFKAPGPSGVPNAALKHCASHITPVFANIVNSCIRHHHHPAEWKFFTTITLRKPGKPSYLVPKAYRPIALEDTSSKVIESVIAHRLAALAEEHQLLPPNHFGGRPRRTTTDAVLHLTQFIKDSWRRGEVTTVLYLDISSAFPSVNHRRLLHNLRKRRVPEFLVLWVAEFLRDRRTQLKFDDYTSEPLLADCGLPQGSPLSSILYLFYSSDLLEIFDPKDRSRTALGYIDDTAMAVSSKSIANNIRTLSQVTPHALDWSERHACRFDIVKFQLVHHTRYAPRYEPLPLQIGPITISPRDSALYLGVLVDRRLTWREHVEAAVAKGTAAVLALGRLARPSFGLPHQYARQLYRSVVCPKVEYGIVVWYTPVQRREDDSRARGSVGIAKRIGRVQRLAALMITGAFRSTSTVVLDYHAGLLPVELRLNLAVHSAAARLASLPDDHLLRPAIQRCSSRYPRFHRSPLHELFHAFPHLCNITPMRSLRPSLPSSPFDVSLESCRDDAKEAADDALVSRDTCVVVQRQVECSSVGVAAVAATRDGGMVSRQACLGSAAMRQGHDGALAAMTLALCAIQGCPRVTRASILVPDRTAVSLLVSQPDLPLCSLFLTQLRALHRARRSLRLRVIWAPLRPEDHELFRTAHRLAGQAARQSQASPELPKRVLASLSNLTTSRAVLQKQYEAEVTAQWQALWLSSTQGQRCANAVDNSPPSLSAPKLYRGLNRQQCSILTQLRSGHASLNAYLARIKAIDSPLCAACGVPETVAHFLFSCKRFKEPRHQLRQAVKGPLTLRNTIGSADARTAVLSYVEATGRFTRSPAVDASQGTSPSPSPRYPPRVTCGNSPSPLLLPLDQ